MPKKKKKMLTCPNCGTGFPAGRLSCPECGSDMETGWKSLDEIEYESVDIPDPYGSEDDSAKGGSLVFRQAFIWLVLVATAMMLVGWGSCQFF